MFLPLLNHISKIEIDYPSKDLGTIRATLEDSSVKFLTPFGVSHADEDFRQGDDSKENFSLSMGSEGAKEPTDSKVLKVIESARDIKLGDNQR